ncbi:hypothetical protein [Streptomyces sp. NPDC046942]|uniref:hypothetical protein n=1 Tax=Streptomyces sp. NPDC046942 TaxID=3155137 RepID=UPI0033C11734
MDVLTWTIEQRMQLAEQAVVLRKELAETDAELAWLEAAEVVFGQWAEGDGQRTAVVADRGARAGAGSGAGGGDTRGGRDAADPGP